MRDIYKTRAFTWVDENGTQKLPGAYYLTEGGLKLDAAALKKGEAYVRDDFYERARAWYKTEIDRLLLNTLEGSGARRRLAPDEARDKPSIEPHKNEPRPRATAIAPNIAHAQAPSSRAQTPTRIQPTRAAKRKAAKPPPPTNRPPKRRKKAQPAERFVPSVETQTNAAEEKTDAEPHGAYTLAAYDWTQFLNGNEGGHSLSPRTYRAMDASYFCIRLEKAVEAKIQEILSRYTAKETDNDSNSVLAPNWPPSSQSTPTTAPSPTTRFPKPPPPPRAPFPSTDPDATFPDSTPLLVSADVTHSWTTQDREKLPTPVLLETEREDKVVAAAPGAEMVISPTLGRWRPPAHLPSDGGGGGDEGGGGPGGETGLLPVEDSGANVVDVSGLRFAVDVSRCVPVVGEGPGTRWAAAARVVML